MTADTIIVVIVVLLFVISGLKKLWQRLEEEAAAGPAARPEFEATSDEIKEFLQGLQAAQPARVQHEAPPLRGGADGILTVLDVAEPRPAAPAERREVPLPPSRVSAETPTAVRRPAARAQPARRPRRRPGRRPREAPPSAGADDAWEAKVPARALKAAAVTPLALRGFGLKQAVVWSEVLGRPVGLRRSRRRPPAETP